jgi:hypothetical protein
MTPAKKLDLGRKGGFLHKAAGYAIVLALSLLVAGLGLRFLAPAATHRLAGEIKRMLGGSPTLVPQQATLRANDGVLLGTDAVARVDGQVEVPSPPPSAPPAPSSLPRLPSAPVDDLPTLPVPAVDPHASIRSGDRTHASSSAMVTLRLVTRPKGAHVRSGSHALGTTPLQRKFPAGVSEELVLTKRGYATVKRMFSVGTSDTTVTVNLDPVSKKAKTKRPARHHHRHRR